MRPIFKHADDEPIKFFLVSGPTNVSKQTGLEPDRVRSLTRAINECSGEIVDDMDEAEVWVVTDDALPTYTRYCANDPDHRAVGEAFIKRCIAQGGYEEEPPIEKVFMRGRYPGRVNLFTEKDEMLLCDWIASKVPVKESGGRLGTVIWRLLYEATAEFPNGMWADAKRHPMSSWRQHYKLNQARLDAIVNKIVKKKGLNPWSRTAYKPDRRHNTGVHAVRVRRLPSGEDEEDEVEAEIHISGDEGSEEDLDYSSTHERPAKRRRTANPQRRRGISQEAGPSGVQRSPSALPSANRSVERQPTAGPSGVQRTLSTPSQANRVIAPRMARPSHSLEGQASEPPASLGNFSQQTLVNPNSPAKTYLRRTSNQTGQAAITGASTSFNEKNRLSGSPTKKWVVKSHPSSDEQPSFPAYIGARPRSDARGQTTATRGTSPEDEDAVEDEEEDSVFEYDDEFGSASEEDYENPFAVSLTDSYDYE